MSETYRNADDIFSREQLYIYSRQHAQPVFEDKNWFNCFFNAYAHVKKYRSIFLRAEKYR